MLVDMHIPNLKRRPKALELTSQRDKLRHWLQVGRRRKARDGCKCSRSLLVLRYKNSGWMCPRLCIIEPSLSSSFFSIAPSLSVQALHGTIIHDIIDDSCGVTIPEFDLDGI